MDFALPAGTHAVTFAPLDATGAPVTMPGGFFFTASFATAGQFTGTITETGAPLGAPVAAATHVILPNTGAANPLGILAPTDAQYPGATSLAVTATGLPGNGTVLFADGITPVALGAALTTTQLTGLTFKPNANSGGQSGSFTYAVTDPDLTTATGSAAIQTACFRAGARIATARGDIPVEQLRVGDLVHASGAGLTPIKWIGHRTLDCRRHPRPADVHPVRVRAHAFSDGMPVRDLWLSPDHAIALYGVLIPIRTLINGTTIVQECVEEVTYYHVELPAHDILRAEGLPAESYLDLGNRSAFDNGGTMVTLHPDLATRLWARDACAELILGGPILTAVRQRLRIQAGWLHRAGAIFPSVVTGEESRTARVCHTANG